MKIKRLVALLAFAFACMLVFYGCASGQTQEEEIKLQKMTFNETELVMGVGDEFQLELSLDPVNATKGRTITLYSANPDKAGVSKDFLVTAKEVGETEIIASSSYGGIEARVKVVIVPKIATGMDLLVSLRGTRDVIYLTNDVTVGQADIDLLQNTAVLIKKPKQIKGGGFTIDLSSIEVTDVEQGVIQILTDEAVVFEEVTIKLPSVFKGKEDKAIQDPEGVLEKVNCTLVAA